ncbi:MAG: NAD-dependent epimerase/dehydratase family protein [Bacteroidetes bacterium]|nr:MAG: NAD-dependent epimerase/dehydratase family protein [Bacteroidota bacterium]
MILVTGATGLVGAHLLFALLQKHNTVRATHRASSDLQAVKKVFSFYTDDVETLYKKIEWIEANIIELPALLLAFKDVNTVYHCAAFVSFNQKKYYDLTKTNVEGTANVVNLCLKNKVEKLCYVSSIATLGSTLNGKPITEETHWNPEENNNVYSITKYGAEMEVWRGMREGLNSVIVNPGVILGEGFWNSSSGIIFKNAARGMKYYTTGSSGFVDVRDVVSTMIQLVESDRSNQRYLLVAANLSYLDLFTRLSISFGKKPPSKAIGKNTMLLLSKLDAILSFLFRRKRKLLKSMVHSMYNISNYNALKITTQLDFQYTPIDETLSRVVKNYSSSS